MERIYRALGWLAAVALLLGLILFVIMTLNSGQLVLSDSSGLRFGAYSNSLIYYAPVILLTFATYLFNGVALFGIAVAWADRRRLWALAMAAAVVVAVLFPFTFTLLFNQVDFYVVHPRVGRWLAQNMTLLIFLFELVPSALALALTWRRGSSAADQKQADAELEITRTPL